MGNASGRGRGHPQAPDEPAAVAVGMAAAEGDSPVRTRRMPAAVGAPAAQCGRLMPRDHRP